MYVGFFLIIATCPRSGRKTLSFGPITKTRSDSAAAQTNTLAWMCLGGQPEERQVKVTVQYNESESSVLCLLLNPHQYQVCPI